MLHFMYEFAYDQGFGRGLMAYIIFDFDGTLADVKALLLEIGNEIAVKKGWQPIDSATY